MESQSPSTPRAATSSQPDSRADRAARTTVAGTLLFVTDGAGTASVVDTTTHTTGGKPIVLAH